MKKIFFSIFFLFLFSSFAQSEQIIQNFKIEPDSLFVSQEGSILFSVQTNSVSQKPQSVHLIEIDKTGGLVRFHWELKDDGSLGDQKSGDGIYSRVVQFKEKSSKTIHFLATDLFNEEMMKKHVPIQELKGLILKADLEIKPRPSMIEILEQIWNKNKK